MALRRKLGFTLIELLVVIAIIGVLAGMLFPVFARARESAHKIQCLSGVKNIAAAVSLYLADWEAFWPAEHDPRVIAYFNQAPGGGTPQSWPQVCVRSYQANPYLRTAVVLEGYVGNRDVWRCPSARLVNGASMIVPVAPGGDWLQVWIANEGKWGQATELGPCYTAWPPGWGGAVTDSFAQDTLAISGARAPGPSGAGIFLQGIGVNEKLKWQNLSAVNDASRYVLGGDCGTRTDLSSAGQLAYPDSCGLGYSGGPENRKACEGADWENCPRSRACGMTKELLQRFYREPSCRRKAARHLGGSNVGFLDGHARWFQADAIMTQSEPFPRPYFEGGVCSCWPGNGVK